MIVERKIEGKKPKHRKLRFDTPSSREAEEMAQDQLGDGECVIDVSRCYDASDALSPV